MIFGTGIDILEVNRMRRQLDIPKGRFFQMLFTEKEIEYCTQAADMGARSQRFAGRFAAKEAFLKALGTGLRDGIKWTDMEILNDGAGKPHINVRNKALNLLNNNNVQAVHVSITHDKSFAAAVVVLETNIKS